MGKLSTKKNAMGKKTTREKPFPIDKLLYPSLLIAISAILYTLFKTILTNTPIERLDATDGLLISDTFTGTNGPYVILCLDEEQYQKGARLNSAFSDSESIISTLLDPTTSLPIAKFATVDCSAVSTKAGSSISTRYGIDETVKPASVSIIGRSGTLTQVKPGHLKSGYTLSKVVRGLVEVRARKVDSTKGMREKCTEGLGGDKGGCVVLMKGGTSTVDGGVGRKEFKDFMAGYADEVEFVTVDCTKLEVQGVEGRMKEEYTEGYDRLVMFTSGDDGGLRVKSFKDVWHKDSLGKWLLEGLSGEDVGGAVKAESIKVKTRSKRSREMGKKRAQDKAKGSRDKVKKDATSKNRKKRSKLFGSPGDGDDKPNYGGGDKKEMRRAERERQKERAERERKEKEDNMTEEEKERRDRRREEERRRRMEEEMNRGIIEEGDEDDFIEVEGGEEEEVEEEDILEL